MKHLLSLTLLLSLCLALAACGAPPAPSGGVTFSDDAGVTVTAPASPARVAVLFSSLADLWIIAGGEVAVTVGESVERELVASDTVLVDGGAGKTVSTELLLAAAPDFVIGSADIPAHAEAVTIARSAGIAGALFHLESFSDYLRILSIMTKITKNPSIYTQKGEALASEIASIKSGVPDGEPLPILFIRAGSTASSTKAKTASDHFAAAMLQELGTRNIADDARVLLDGLSLEDILLADPSCIFISTMGDEAAARENIERLFSEAAWRELTAVREGRCYFLPKSLFQYKPNDEWAAAYRTLAELLYANDS